MFRSFSICLFLCSGLLSCSEGADQFLLFSSKLPGVEIHSSPLINGGLTARNRSYTMFTGRPQEILLSGSGESNLTYVLDGAPASGSLSGTGQTLTYRANPGFSGEDSFEYHVSSGQNQSSSARVYIRVVDDLCTSGQVGAGPVNDLRVHIPVNITERDLSSNQFSVTSVDTGTPGGAWKSRTDLSTKQLSADLGTLPPVYSLSLRLQSVSGSGNQTLLENNALTIQSKNGGVEVQIKDGSGGSSTFVNDASTLKTGTCNHFALIVEPGAVKTWLNGKALQWPIESGNLLSPTGQWKLGPFSGQVWDFRVYERSLTDIEIQELGDQCADERLATGPYVDYPEYYCGPYVCEWWPEGITDVTDENLLYYVKSQNMVYERHIFEGGMYPRSDFCGYFASRRLRDLQLSEGIRRTFVKPYTENKPFGQHWLHENFHSFQGNLSNALGFGGSKFFLESTASWGADAIKPGVYDTILGFYTLHPHLPLWTIQNSPVDHLIGSEFKGGHQYGASIFEAYLTRRVLGNNMLIGDVYNDSRAGREPARVIYELLERAGCDMRDVFGDFAVQTINWDYDYGDLYRQSELGSLQRMKNAKPDAESHDTKITAVYGDGGTGDLWTPVPDKHLPGSWAYNAFQVNVADSHTYAVEFRPSAANPAYAEFRGRVAVKPLNGAIRYFSLPEAGPDEAVKVLVNTNPGDEIYLVVSSTPSTRFKDFETYNYDYKIHPVTGLAWTSSDIGNTNFPGSVTEVDGTYEVIAAGNDVYFYEDDFYFLHLPLNSDGSITVRVTGVENVHPWAKGGIMIRESLDPNSRHVSIFAAADNPVAFERRALIGGWTRYSLEGSGAPVWLRLVRAGDLVSAFRSDDGVSWTPANSYSLSALSSSVFMGLAVSSHDPARTVRVTFDKVSVVR